ncbi:MAG: hypothetical protein KY394_07485, partial [Actinobacteria bacterium]|nr:hypothetical protein [Actinomycetota bacterium]
GVGLAYVCNVKSGSNVFVWSSGEGDFDLYQEFTSATPQAKMVDGRVSWESDHLEVPASSPSQPLEPVEPITSFDPADQTFIDVEADCSG